MEKGPSASKKIRRSLIDSSELKNKESKTIMNELNGEYVLQHLMHNVCQYLNMYDLSHVGQVCKSWNMEVKRELDKRYHYHLMTLPYLHSDELDNSSFHVSKILDNEPKLTILLPGTNHKIDDNRDEIELEYDTYSTYRKQLPNVLVVVGVLEAIMNTDVIHSCPVLMNSKVMEEYSPAGTLCFSLPMNKRLNIKHVYLYDSDWNTNAISSLYTDMINELLPTTSNTKSTLIVFATKYFRTYPYFDNTLIYLQNLIKVIFPPKSYTLWGFAASHRIFFSSKHSKYKQSITQDLRLICLNLLGTNVESWSIIIHVNNTKREMEEKLLNFKDRIRLKRHGVGLITAPVVIKEPGDTLCYTDSHELVDEVKKIFPEIFFLGAFCEDDDIYFGIDPIEDNESNALMYSKIISIMVFTYE